mmetsp:Transcript_21915/g.55366  ORF Transcript_21915/g.55366 Transcript_21915/m.55366 type:complete len:333 (-) Transcript_21915:98-1096(-)
MEHRERVALSPHAVHLWQRLDRVQRPYQAARARYLLLGKLHRRERPRHLTQPRLQLNLAHLFIVPHNRFAIFLHNHGLLSRRPKRRLKQLHHAPGGDFEDANFVVLTSHILTSHIPVPDSEQTVAAHHRRHVVDVERKSFIKVSLVRILDHFGLVLDAVKLHRQKRVALPKHAVHPGKVADPLDRQQQAPRPPRAFAGEHGWERPRGFADLDPQSDLAPALVVPHHCFPVVHDSHHLRAPRPERPGEKLRHSRRRDLEGSYQVILTRGIPIPDLHNQVGARPPAHVVDVDRKRALVPVGVVRILDGLCAVFRALPLEHRIRVALAKHSVHLG